MRRLFPLIALLAWAIPLSASFLLDDVMPKSVQKRTGVYKLNHNQKQLLEKWLNDTFVLKNAPSPSASLEQDLYITQNIDNGRKLRLNDNSLWEVSPSDISVAALWLTASPLKIEGSDDPDYPCLIINTYTGIGIHCRLLEASPIVD